MQINFNNHMLIIRCNRYACVIDLDDKFLVTGGAYPGDRKQVTKYDYVSGFVRKMPGLNGKGRSHHGCGQFINNENQQASKNKITKFFDYFCFQWVNIKLLTQTKY